MSISSKYVCDNCILRMIKEKPETNIKELRKLRISIERARRLGWKAFGKLPVRECIECGNRFSPRNENQVYCRKDGCKSVDYGNITITKKHKKVKGRSACRVVVCNSVATYRDMIFKRFPGIVEVNDFNKLFEAIMKKYCGIYMKPSAIALSIFFFLSGRKYIVLDIMRDEIKVSEGTIILYVKKFNIEEIYYECIV